MDPDTYKRLTVLPSARRTFSTRDELIAATEIYQPAKGRDLDVIATISDAAGREHYRRLMNVAGRDFNAAGGAYPYSVQIPLTGISGDVVLTIEARLAESEAPVAARRVAFAVR